MTSGTTLMNNAEWAELKTSYPELQITPLTTQQEQIILFHLRGMSGSAAAVQAGYTPDSGLKFLRSPKAQLVLQHLREKQVRRAVIDTDMLNSMLLAAHAKAANATEEIMAVRELGRLNDLYPAERKVIKAEIKEVANTKQLERLSDEDLLALGGTIIDLEPEQVEYGNAG